MRRKGIKTDLNKIEANILLHKESTIKIAQLKQVHSYWVSKNTDQGITVFHFDLDLDLDVDLDLDPFSIITNPDPTLNWKKSYLKKM